MNGTYCKDISRFLSRFTDKLIGSKAHLVPSDSASRSVGSCGRFRMWIDIGVMNTCVLSVSSRYGLPLTLKSITKA